MGVTVGVGLTVVVGVGLAVGTRVGEGLTAGVAETVGERVKAALCAAKEGDGEAVCVQPANRATTSNSTNAKVL